MKLEKLLLILFVIAALSASITLYTYSSLAIYKSYAIPMDVKVSDKIGFNLDKDALHFGTVTSPGTVNRAIDINNSLDRDVMIVIQSSGKLAEWVTHNTSFELSPGEQREVNFRLDVPSNVSHGNYTGNVKIFFKRIFLS